MSVNPLVVNELRSLFKAGATPSALIRRIADYHTGELNLDGLVRDYFREAFHVPMLRIGLSAIERIAAGEGMAALNRYAVHQMIQTRAEWNQQGESVDNCWLDSVTATDEAVLNERADPASVPELAGAWDSLDEGAKAYIKRVFGNAHLLHERVVALAALAEQLQLQVPEAVNRLSD